MKNLAVVTTDGVESQSEFFSHPGLIYDHSKRKLTLTEEARSSLEAEVLRIQSGFPENQTIEQEPFKALSTEIAHDIADAMIQDGKGEKTTRKFFRRVGKLLRGKGKKGGGIEKKVEEAVSLYNHGASPRHDLYIQINDGSVKIDIHIPFIVHPGRSIDDMLRSYNSRLANTKHFKE